MAAVLLFQRLAQEMGAGVPEGHFAARVGEVEQLQFAVRLQGTCYVHQLGRLFRGLLASIYTTFFQRKRWLRCVFYGGN